MAFHDVFNVFPEGTCRVCNRQPVAGVTFLNWADTMWFWCWRCVAEEYAHGLGLEEECARWNV